MHKANLFAISAALMLASHAIADSSKITIINPSGRTFEKEPVRLQVSLPADAKPGSVVVRNGATEVPSQIEAVDGKPVLWVAATVAPTGRVTYAVSAGKPTAAPVVKIAREGGQYVLDNGLIAVKVPAAATELIGPVTALKLPNGKWIGGSTWQTGLKLKSFSATVIGDGTVFAKLRMRYEFDGMAGIDGAIPAFAEVDVSLAPGWKHVELYERHEMGNADSWTFELSQGWSPRQGVSRPFSGGFSSAEQNEPPPAKVRELKPVTLSYFPPDLFINLFPRWNQHCKDGWAFYATDGDSSAGVVVVRASRWVWPHQNSIRAAVKPSGDYAGLRCPTGKGQRLWWLVASVEPVDVAYVAAHAWEHLDKLNNEMILDWDGKFGKIPSINFYSGDHVNPTGGIRGRGKSAMANAGKPLGWDALAEQQVRMHPDSYGSYWNFWSPENPNFFTDFYKIPIAMASNLKAHPQFEAIRKQAEAKFMEDLYHSIAMPGGAGQECPGYFDYALRGHLKDLAELCSQHLGFEPSQTDRFKAGLRFLERISQPDGGVRRMLPMGDTHPAKDGPRLVEVPQSAASTWMTEEFPGFGVIFNSKPGTPEETYLAFKSGPSRGHYHGDQLSIHLGAHAKPLAVDHHCSYHPRAGQEHMHNRVAFWRDGFPYANMDGFERLIGFKTSAAADIAIGQVESTRLRKTEKLPPEFWHQEFPQFVLSKPLIYRRTVVVVKSEPQSYIVLRDQFWGAENLNATFCLHVLSNTIDQKGPIVDFGNLQLYCASPSKTSFESFPWTHENGGVESTQGARVTQRTDNGEFISVLYPGKLPAVSSLPQGIKVGDDEIVFGGTEPVDGGATVYVDVKVGGKNSVSLVGKDVDLNRSQGDMGLFVPDAGYPFGDIPDWLIRQRSKVPGTAPAWVKPVRAGHCYGDQLHIP